MADYHADDPTDVWIAQAQRVNEPDLQSEPVAGARRLVDANLITGARGDNQYLGHQAAHHADQSTIAPGEGNRIPRRSLPLVRDAKVGPPDSVNPLGRGFGNSLDGGDGGGGDE